MTRTLKIACGLSGEALIDGVIRRYLEANHGISVVDPLFRERNGLSTKLLHLPKETLTKVIEETGKHLHSSESSILGWSFGGLAMILQTQCTPIEKAIFVSPLIGGDTMVLSLIKRILIQFFPALNEAHSQKTQDKVFEKLKVWKEKGIEIVFVLPRNGEYTGDNKVVYSPEVICKMKKVGTVIFIEGIRKHEEMLQNKNFLDLIKEVIGF